MSDTNIYNRRDLPPGKPRSRKPRRRRSTESSRRRFDEPPPKRKRRSRNSGFRRLLHLYRKEHIQRRVWRAIFAIFIIGLVLLAVWQFWYRDYLYEKKAAQIEAQQLLNEGDADTVPRLPVAPAPAEE